MWCRYRSLLEAARRKLRRSRRSSQLSGHNFDVLVSHSHRLPSSTNLLDPLMKITINSVSDAVPYTLTDEQQDFITRGEPDRVAKLQELLLFLFVKRQKGEVMPSEVRLEDVDKMVGMKTNQVNRRLHTIMLQIQREEKNLLEQNSLFSCIDEANMECAYNAFSAKYLNFGQKVVFDCSFEPNVKDIYIRKTANQLILSLLSNRLSRRPFSIHLCNFNSGSRLMYHLENFIPGFTSNAPVIIHSGSYLDVFEKSQLMYLSPLAKKKLQYDPNDVYVLGKMVENHNESSFSKEKAKREGIRCAFFPLLGQQQEARVFFKPYQCFESLLLMKKAADLRPKSK